MYNTLFSDLDMLFEEDFDFIIDQAESIINDTNTACVLDSIFHLTDTYLDENILTMQDPNFHEILEEDLLVFFKIAEENILTDLPDYAIYDIAQIINIGLKLYFLTYPPRSSGETCVTNINHSLITIRVENIRSKYQPIQRTEEWYNFRHNLITASNAFKIFGGQCSVNSIILEKCKPISMFSDGFVNVDSPMHWGQKYEPVSLMIYKEMYNTDVEDFGCIAHDTYSFLGASPDGIITDLTSSRYGRMLEIKNIVNREINGIPKKEYWIQMQLQMEVCDLDECDFLETKFTEYGNEKCFLEDKSDRKKGLIMYFHDRTTNKPVYFYKPLQIPLNETDNWVSTIIQNTETDENLCWIRNIYWKLEIFSCVLVMRNPYWFQSGVSKIQDVWDVILKERISGFSHREPKKRARKIKESVLEQCLFASIFSENVRNDE